MDILEKNRENNLITLKISENYDLILEKSNEIFPKESAKYRIPGFRKGKAPRKFFDQYVGEGFLLEKAMNEVMNRCYLQVIKKENLQPVDYPNKVDLIQFEKEKPFIFTISVEVKPEVKLKKYLKIKAEKRKLKISDPEVQQDLDSKRERFVKYLDIDEPIKQGDIIRYDIKAWHNDQPIPEFTKTNQGLKVGVGSISSDFDDQFIGLSKNKEKEFSLSFPDTNSHNNLKGKTVKFYILITEVKRKKLPELDDDLAKKLGSDSLKALKENTLKELEKKEKDKIENDFKNAVIDELINLNPIDIPNPMIENQINIQIENFKHYLKKLNINWEDYLKMSKKEEASFREEHRDPAKRKVAIDLILEQIAEKENIEITSDELEAEYQRIAKEEFKKELEEVRENIDRSSAFIKNYLKTDKAMKLVIDKVKVKFI